MPVEVMDLLKLTGGVILLIIPGYLWSFFFFKNITRLERVVFGFVVSLITLTMVLFVLSSINFPITWSSTVLLYLFYTIPILCLYGYTLYKTGFPGFPKKRDIINVKYLALLGVLCFAGLMALMPHWSNSYYLPFHVDEWIHYTYTQAVIESGSTTFVNPYTGVGTTSPLEIGFHVMNGILFFLSGTSLVTLFVFLPTVFMVLTSLTVYNVDRDKEKPVFGLMAAFLISFIPTTCRYLGPSFYVPVGVALLFLGFIIWLFQQKPLHTTLLFPAVVFFLFIFHPPSALAAVILIVTYGLLLLLGKHVKRGVLSIGLTLLPIVVVLVAASRWAGDLGLVMDAVFGSTFELAPHLSRIYTSFDHLGVITWVLFIFGTYAAWDKGKETEKAIVSSAILLIVAIGIYDKFGYGMPIFYDRAFLYLYFLVAIGAAFGVYELTVYADKFHHYFSEKNKQRHIPSSLNMAVPVAVVCILLFTVVPVHLDIPYYHLIDEQDYETFMWIHENLDGYRNETCLYERGVVDPFKASPFCAVTGLYIVSSTMHPIYGYMYHDEVEAFLSHCCNDTGFLETFNVSVIYNSCCDNDNLSEVHPHVFLYPGASKN